MRSSLLARTSRRAQACALFTFSFALFGLANDSMAAATPSASLVPFIVKAADYDRHFSSKAAGRVRIFVTYNAADAASQATADDLVKNLSKAGKIGGFSHDEHALAFSGAEALASTVRADQAAIVIVSTGLGGEVRAIAHELDGIDVISVAVDPEDVARGIVLGLDARDGKSKIVVRLSQARRQDVVFEASLLSLARIE